jgi:hypothetical protein
MEVSRPLSFGVNFWSYNKTIINFFEQEDFWLIILFVNLNRTIGMVFLGGVMGAQGVVLLDYQAGIGTGTSTGASDPATQGWAYSGSGSGFSDGFDAGTGVGTTYGGGWRTVDGTSGAQSVYTQDTSPIIGAITAADIWRMSWTVALDQDAVRTVGAAVTDYYNAPNQGRQNAILLYFDMDDVDSFRVVHRVNEFDEVLLDVSGTQYNTGVSLDNFGSYSITYNKAAGTALLDYGAGTATINPSSVDPNRSTIFMGSGSSGGQGSGVWNSMVIETNPVPEPSSVLLSLLGGLALLRRRR